MFDVLPAPSKFTAGLTITSHPRKTYLIISTKPNTLAWFGTLQTGAHKHLGKQRTTAPWLFSFTSLPPLTDLARPLRHSPTD
ncbi:hypothetical protein VTK56DRAFT_5701 [Thermocarpiscus australiensis]